MASLGVTGDVSHVGGYHCGRDRVVSGDYSVVQSSRDWDGLSGYASALDIGTFTVTVAGKRHDLRSFSIWLVAQCKANASDAVNIREVIYSPDGKVVRRWDRLGIQSGGDSSHLYHTHISYFRDATKAGRDLTGLYRRYLTEIGVIQNGPTGAEVITDADVEKIAKRTLDLIVNYQWPAGQGSKSYSLWRDSATAATQGRDLVAGVDTKVTQVAEQTGQLAPETVSAIREEVAAELTEQLAPLLPPTEPPPSTEPPAEPTG